MNLDKNNSGNKNKWVKSILYGILFIVLFLLILISFSSRWALSTWAGLTMDEIVYHLKAPLEGTGDGLVGKYVIQCIVPTIVILLAISLIMFLKQKWKRIVGLLSLVVSSLFFIICVCQFWTRLDISGYIEAQRSDTSFIKEHYVDPWDVSIEFPEEKRNLIFIYLESMETTYADVKNGGALDFNCIPELTELAQENEDFSGNETILNGAYVMPATGWTMGALFGHTSGLPLQISIEGNSMDTQNTFFPSIVSIGDILESEGYKQVFMIGSDVNFGGRKLYFTEHGSYEIFDYEYAKIKNFIPKNYKVFWGYEDKKLFSFAKEKLLMLSKEEKPFNLTLLTVDTHCQDGYICDNCNTEFGDNQYANVIACSSKQVDEFVKWIQEQDFYENTAIVLVGDHLTMDSDFCNEVASNYDRKIYVNYINSAYEPEQIEWKRTYTTFDTFPTTLASMGVKIKGNRLGLGTNLFSSKKTLAEEYGVDYLYTEVEKKSEFLVSLAEIDEMSDDYLKRVGNFPSALVNLQYDKKNERALISVSNIINLENISKVEIDLIPWDTNEVQTFSLNSIEDESYLIKLDWSLYKNRHATVKVYVVDSIGRRYQIEELPADISLYTNNFSEYLNLLNEKENCTIFISVQDDASHMLSLEWKMKLKDLGLSEDLSKNYRSSYYAIIDNGQVLTERIGKEVLYEEGVFNQEKDTFYILSEGNNTGKINCYIEINEKDYAMHSRGINIVVYDNFYGAVLDSVCFDTHDGKTVYRNGKAREQIFENASVLMQLDNSLQEINEFNKYIESIKEKEEYTIFITVKDEASYNFTETMQNSLKTLGLNTNLLGKYRYSYYAIIDQGNVLEEEIGLEKLETYGTLQNEEVIYEVISAGAECGCIASIKLNGKEFAVSSTGLNIVIYDNSKNCVVDTVCFNTHSGNNLIRSDGENLYEIQEKLDKSRKEYIPEVLLQLNNIDEYLDILFQKDDYIIFMAIKDEGTFSLTEDLMAKFKNLGIESELLDKYRYSYYAVINNGKVLERLAQEEISHSAILEDNFIKYNIVSAGGECGNRASIKINEQEYAINARGLNIVVYDKLKDCIVDSVCFDTHSGLTAIR